MKNLLVLLFTTLSFAQNTTNGLVIYSQIESLGLGAKNGPEAISSLLFNQQEALYITKKDSLQNLSATLLKEFYENNQTGLTMVNPNVYTTPKGFEVYINLGKDSIWSSYKWREYAYLKEKRKDLNWKLSTETKKIGNFNCQKAIGHLRGRDYIAWFTTEIPVPFGPWKLHGLPGLILEAYTPDEEIYFYARKIEYPTKKGKIEKITIEKGKKWLTFSEYLKWHDENLDYAYEKGILLGVNAIRGTQKGTFKEFTE